MEWKGGYNQLCDIWAVGITGKELAELQPRIFDLHPMSALFLTTKSNFQPPKLKDTKNPKKGPAAEKLLQHHLVSQPLSQTPTMELLDKANNLDHGTYNDFNNGQP